MVARLRRNRSLIVMTIVLGLGLLILVYAGSVLARGLLVALDGETASGTVLSKGREPGTSGGGPTYTVRYRFTAGEATFDGDDVIGSEEWGLLTVGGPITVHYARSLPGLTNGVEGDATNSGPLALLLFTLVVVGAGIIFTAVSGPFVVRSLRASVLQRRLVRVGLTAAGTVDAVLPTRYMVNGRGQWRLQYRFPDASGGEHTGRSTYLADDEAARWQPGDACLVRYDPARPERSVWLGSDLPGERTVN